jgi:gluconokinase
VGRTDASWILVLDVGSSSVRARLFDPEGRGRDPGPAAQRPSRWRSPEPGSMEYEAGELLDHAVAALDAGVAHAREAGLAIGAVAVTTFWHSLLGLGPDGSPATPVYGWGDTRAAAVALRLRERVGESALHRRTGCFLHPSYPAVKLAWLRERDPRAFAAVSRWVSFAEFLESRLLRGGGRCSLSMASATGLLDVRRLRWDAEALALAGVAEAALPPLVDADEPLRGLRPEPARRWPELADVPWFPALGDGACANVGSGAVGRGRIALTVGTSAALRALWEPEGEEVPEGLWCYRLDRRHWVAGGALANGGSAIAYLQRTLRLPPPADWEARVAAMEPDSHGLTVLPFLLGERGPGWTRERAATVLGLTGATPPEQLLRAWMEAIAYQVVEIRRRLEEVVGRECRIEASGGALHASHGWTRIFADALGRPLVLGAEREATARGAALVAQAAMGWRSELPGPPEEAVERFVPDPERAARYRAAHERQRRLLSLLEGWTGPDHPPAAGQAPA